jgi:cytochrome b subunit of formate dehydrogenase
MGSIGIAKFLIFIFTFSLSPKEECGECHDVNLSGSVHRDVECVDCHMDIKGIPHEGIEMVPKCGCHEDEIREHKESIHGKAIIAGIKEAAHCWDCHGSHNIPELSDSSSPVFPLNLPFTCGKCHGDPELAHRYNIPIENPYQLYEQSVHHTALMEGKHAATCSDCHGVHDIQNLTAPLSPISKINIPRTCSKCHRKEYGEYIESIHFTAFKMGVREAPVCNDCHAEHRILPPDDPKSPIYPLNIPKTCSDCHERYVIIEKYGIPGLRLATYLKSYHGIALRAGNIYAAHCVSCHQNHFILPSEDPRSLINPVNLPKVCGKCHPGIRFGEGGISIHKIGEELAEKIIEIVKRIYIFLIVITIGSMVFYTSIDWIKKTRHPESIKREIHKDTLKFNRLERFLHFAHLISFIILAYTGFAHHYPDNVFTSWLSGLLHGSVRAYLHRGSGTLLILTFILHIFLVIFTKRGRKQLLALIPQTKDLKDSLLLLFYNLGLKNERPHYEGFTFYEKFEYWAFIWGTGIMGITGLGLWFSTQTLSLLPKWILDLFMVIHFYEAILATLAILVWHLYWVMFDPEVYPVNRLMFSSRIGTLQE